MFRQVLRTDSGKPRPYPTRVARWPGIPSTGIAIVALLLCHLSGCRSGPTHAGDVRVQHDGTAALDSVEAALIDLQSAMVATAPGSQPRTCRSSGGAWVLASNYDGRTYDCPAGVEDGTGDVFHNVLLALTEDWTPLLATLKQLLHEPGGDSYGHWAGWYRPMLAETVDHVEWIMAELRAAHEQRLGYNGEGWGGAVLHYERALHGTHVIAVWLSWLDFAHRASQAINAMHRERPVEALGGARRIYRRVPPQWGKVAPVLSRLRDEPPMRLARTAQLVQTRLLPEWSRGLYEWGKVVREQLDDMADSVRRQALVQAAFEIVLTGRMFPMPGRAKALPLLLPGIGRVMAGGTATGVRVVIRAERVRALQHLIAIGAVTGVAALDAAMTHSLATGAAPSLPQPAAAQSTTRFHKHHTVPKEILKKHLPADVANHPLVRGRAGAPNRWYIPEHVHKAIHKGPRGGAYNEAFKKRIRALRRDPTVDDVLRIRDDLVKKFGLERYRP